MTAPKIFQHLWCLPVAGALAACTTTGGVTDASCAVISSTGGCTLATELPSNAPPPPATALLSETTTTVYTAFGGSRQIVELVPETGVRVEEFKSAVTPATSRQIEITYDPVNASFRVQIQQPLAGVGIDDIYDDPLFRTAFGNARFPQAGTPDLPNFSYLQKGPIPSAPNDVFTFFYENPGTRTRFVTLAGFIRNSGVTPVEPTVAGEGEYLRERSAFVFGTPSPASRVPTSGTATFNGGLLASAIYNVEIDTTPDIRSRSEWISGTSAITVNFAQNMIDIALSGSFTRTSDAFEGSALGLSAYNSSNGGRNFFASGTAAFGTARPAFSGTITSASVGGRSIPVAVGTVTGSMFGNLAQEIGGNFRIVGGGPDQRIEIIGGFTGSK